MLASTFLEIEGYQTESAVQCSNEFVSSVPNVPLSVQTEQAYRIRHVYECLHVNCVIINKIDATLNGVYE